jgi:hypothetical protein
MMLKKYQLIASHCLLKLQWRLELVIMEQLKDA